MKKRPYTTAIMIMIPILAAELIAGYLLISNGALRNVGFHWPFSGESSALDSIKQEVVKEAVEKAISAELGEDVDIDEMKKLMTEDDAAQVDELLEKYSDTAYIQSVLETVTENGKNVSESLDEIKGSVDMQDVEAFKELYDKYSDTILNTVTN